MKNVNENSLNKKLYTGIFISSGIAVAIIVMTILLLIAMQDSLDDIIAGEMKAEATEYKSAIRRQIEKEFESIETLAEIFSHGDMTDSDWFAKCLYDANEKNGFTTMTYFNKEGIGTLVSAGKIKKNVDYRDLNEYIHEPVEMAMKGQKALSKLFQSAHVKEKIFAYCVPVFTEDDTQVMGVLLVGSNVDKFEGVLGPEQDSSEKKHAVHLVNKEGMMLLSNIFKDRSLVADDVFHEPEYFTEEEQQEIDRALIREEDLYTHMKYLGEDFKVYLTPVGVNNWYIMYVNRVSGVNKTAYRMVNGTGMAFVLLMSIILIMLDYACYLIASNNKMLRNLAYNDSLTGSDNILRFNQKLDRKKKEGNGFCLVALNIQQFKFINEIFGIGAADSFLCAIDRELKDFIREGEFFCRESGDMFYICLSETTEDMARMRVEALLDKIKRQKISKRSDYQVIIYAGALICDKAIEQSASNELLITRVRFAMQSCKKNPKEKIHFYDIEIHKNEEMRNFVETHMHQALEKGEFKLYLQPKISMKDKKMGGAEALVRWVTGDGRMIYPDVFIPQFEENGFCVQLDLYMVEQVFALIRRWIDEGVEPIPISVNQSKLLFFHSSYLDTMQQLLDKYKIPPSLITLEILESLALHHTDEINDKLHQLRKMGFCISMDDFGSGYSSFNTLGNLEIDELKLDRSFLVEASSSRNNRFCTIMEHIVNLTKSLQIVTVAEGVETLENEEMIRDVGCDYGQGYLYSRPISEEEFSMRYMNAE